MICLDYSNLINLDYRVDLFSSIKLFMVFLLLIFTVSYLRNNDHTTQKEVINLGILIGTLITLIIPSFHTVSVNGMNLNPN